MAPTDRIVPRFAAEPPQESLPYGDWAGRLQAEILPAFLGLEQELEPDDRELLPDGLGQPGAIAWFPDRTWGGRTFVPATCRTSTGVELYGVISFAPATADGEEPAGFRAVADWTTETADQNPDWTIDLCDEVVGGWRGDPGHVAAMTLVWGRPVGVEAYTATAELGELTVDRCNLIDGRFTLLAPDGYHGDTLAVACWGADHAERARESLYED
ncbi:MAG: hypothetical protein V9E83_09350 [Baekduia sp.]